jgi:hypothetical protein
MAQTLLASAWSAVSALLAFRLLMPYAFVGPGLLDVGLNGNLVESLRSLAAASTGETDYPPGYQWSGRVVLWFPWKNMVLAGMGPALGIAAWAGWALGGWELAHSRRAEHLVPWLWVLTGFAWFGTRWVMTLRYFLPLYPVLCLYAALLVARAAGVRPDGGWRAPVNRGGRAAAAILAALVLAGTVLWAAAFTAIYRRPHSRITASRWIYEHAPPGATIAIEHWDDPLPLALDGLRPRGRYRFVELANYDDDSPAKLEALIVALDGADYVVLSSGRLVETIGRLPGRFPMTARYYRALLSGELGFALAADVASYPTLGGIALPDGWAEEAFTVYDHPRVRVFRKTAGWDPAAARRLLGEVDWSAIDLRPPRALRPG